MIALYYVSDDPLVGSYGRPCEGIVLYRFWSFYHLFHWSLLMAIEILIEIDEKGDKNYESDIALPLYTVDCWAPVCDN